MGGGIRRLDADFRGFFSDETQTRFDFDSRSGSGPTALNPIAENLRESASNLRINPPAAAPPASAPWICLGFASICGVTISPADLAAQLRTENPPRLLDVRESEEHAFCALPNSRLAPLSELMEHVEELADWRDQEVVVYCHHGVRSAHAIALLRPLGFTRLKNLSGGIDRWSQEVDPAVPRY